MFNNCFSLSSIPEGFDLSKTNTYYSQNVSNNCLNKINIK